MSRTMLTTSVETFTYDTVIVRFTGVLNLSTYRKVRDSVVKAALDEPAAVIVDVNDLRVDVHYAWSVFTSARWYVNQWPDIPMALVTTDVAAQLRLAGLSVTRYVPVFASVGAAANAVGTGTCRYRHRARAQFSRHDGGVRAAQMFVRNHLVAWSIYDKIPVATAVATVFIDNALSYTGTGCDLRVEATDEEVFLAVSDASSVPPVCHDRRPGGAASGLQIVARLCPRWGTTPTSDGKTVWARIGPGDTPARLGREAW